MVEKELVRDSNSLRDNFQTLISTKDIMNRVEIHQNFDSVFFVYEGVKKVETAYVFPLTSVCLITKVDFLIYSKTISYVYFGIFLGNSYHCNNYENFHLRYLKVNFLIY